MQGFRNEGSIEMINQYEYVRKMGAYKPRFEGIPEDYFPLTGPEVCMYTIFVLAVIGSTLGMMIGFTFWTRATGLESYIIVWSIVAILFVLVLIILFYAGGKGRIREEKEMILRNEKKEEKEAMKALNAN